MAIKIEAAIHAAFQHIINHEIEGVEQRQVIALAGGGAPVAE